MNDMNPQESARTSRNPAQVLFSGRGRLLPLAVGCAAVTLAACLWLALNSSGGAASPSPRPELLASQTFRFGTKWVGQQVLHTFQIRNPTDHPINITRVAPSCSCTLVGEVPRIVPPRGTANIPLRVELSQESQDFSSVVAVTFDQYPPVKLVIIGNVLRPAPDTVSLGPVKRGERTSKTFAVRSKSGRPIEVLRTVLAGRYFEVRQGRSPADTNNAEIEVSLKDGVPFGRLHEGLTLYTNDPDSDRITVALEAQVHHLLEVRPDVVSFGVVEAGREARQILTVSTPYAGALSVSEIEILPAHVGSCETRTIDTGNEIGFPIVFSGRFEPGSSVVEGTIRVKGRVGGEPAVRDVKFFAVRR